MPADTVDLRIRRVEAECDLLQYKVDDWCVWPLLRFGVAMELQNLPMVSTDSLRRIERLVMAIQHMPELLFLRKARYVAKTYSSARAEQEDNLYKDLYFDDLLRDIGDHFKIESINNKEFFARSRAALIRSDLTTTVVDFFSGRLMKIGRLPKDAWEVAHNLSMCIQREFGVEIFTPQRIALGLLYFYWSKKLYAWLLSRIQPEYLFVSDPGEYHIVAAAKELGIKVIEFQHGFIDRYHTAYSWSAYALPYKASMPIPDRIFLYGVHWQQELTANGFWREELCPVGSLRMDQYRKIKAMNKGGKEEDVYTIVLTTQGMDVEGVIAFVSDFLAAASGQLNFRLYIRLHPVYETDKSPYVGAFRTNNHVQVLLGNEQPSTFELLTRAHLHLSISSTCHYDALGLGVPTVILPFVTHEIILPLHKAGHAFLVQTPQELVNIALQCKNYVVPDKVVELYFKPGALENMKRELGV